MIGEAKYLMNQHSVENPKTYALEDRWDGEMINIPSVFDHVMTSSIEGIINHDVCADQHEDDALIVQSLVPYAAALFVAISMIIFAFGRASCQRTIVIQGGWKMMMPFPITLSRFVFFAFLTSHGCVFGYDEVGENHRAVHESIRGTNAAMAKPSMITKLVKVRKPTSLCLVLFYYAL